MKKNFLHFVFRVTCTAVAVFAFNTAQAVFTPVTLATSGPGALNADVVADGIGLPTTSTTHAFDNTAYVLVTQNYQANSSSTTPPNFMPPTGLLTSTATTGLTFQLAPYTGNNSLRLTGTNSGTLNITPNTLIGDVYLLGASGDGSSTCNVTITFVGNTTQVFNNVSFSDWFGGNPYVALGLGRANRTTGVVDIGSNTLGSNPRLYQAKLTLAMANYTKQIQSITIARNSGAGVLNVMAVTIDHQTCLPPQNLALVGTATLTGANLSWTPTAGAAGYEYALTNSATPPLTGTSIGATPATYNATGLTPATTYYFHLRTDCGGGSFSVWNTVSFSTPACPTATALSALAANITMTTANITWNAPATSVGFEYALTTTNTPPATGTFQTTTGYNATGLNAATTYWFHVRNVCIVSGAYSNWSTTSFTTKPCPPAPSLSAPAATITTTTADLSWGTPPASSNPSSGYEYAVTNSATPPATGTPVATTFPMPYTATGLTPGTTYYLHVRNACTGGFYSTWSTLSFTTKACPTAGTPVVTVNTPGTVTFTWPGTTVPGLVTYQYAVTNTSTTPSTWLSTAATTATVNNLAPGATYYAHVRSNCGPTNAVSSSVQFVNPFPPCFAPLGMGIDQVNMFGANISWSAGVNGLGYEYAVTTSLAPPASGTATPDTFYVATGLTSNTKYYVHVRTHCGSTPFPPVVHNFSPWITDSFTTPATCLPPDTPSVYNITTYSAQMSWNLYPGIGGYEIFVDESPTPPSFAGLPINFNVYHPLNLNSGTTYYIHLRTKCDNTNFSPWVTQAFTTLPVCGSTAPVPTITSVEPTGASFSWPFVQGAQSYEYAVTTTATPPTGGGNFTSQTNVTVSNLVTGTPYFFHLRAYCSASDRTAWETIPFTPGTNSVNGALAGGAFFIELYPNPATDVLNVNITGRAGSGRIQILDIAGKVVFTETLESDKSELNISSLPAGMYLLKYVDREHAGVLRVEKQ